MIDHDRLFKELLTTFFWEFLDRTRGCEICQLLVGQRRQYYVLSVVEAGAGVVAILPVYHRRQARLDPDRGQ